MCVYMCVCTGMRVAHVRMCLCVGLKIDRVIKFEIIKNYDINDFN